MAEQINKTNFQITRHPYISIIGCPINTSQTLKFLHLRKEVIKDKEGYVDRLTAHVDSYCITPDIKMTTI